MIITLVFMYFVVPLIYCFDFGGEEISNKYKRWFFKGPLIIFSLEIVFAFNTGVYNEGVPVLDRLKIVK